MIGALADLSYMECHALRSLGAMGTDTYAERPEAACRPFDRHTDGFIFGEACGAIVLERAECAEERGARSWAGLKGWGMASDANRNPNPSAEGEMTVIRQALERAGLSAKRSITSTRTAPVRRSVIRLNAGRFLKAACRTRGLMRQNRLPDTV